jgi:transposase
VVESTADSWRPLVDLLEGWGLTGWLVGARDVTHLPGRPKTDKLEAVWLASLNERAGCDPGSSPLPRSAGCGTCPGCGPT